jgi:hypothetical protein
LSLENIEEFNSTTHFALKSASQLDHLFVASAALKDCDFLVPAGPSGCPRLSASKLAGLEANLQLAHEHN